MNRRRLLYENGSSVNYGTGTQDDPFLIYIPNDLLLVNNITRNGGVVDSYHGSPTAIAFEGQYLKVVNDLDMSSVCSSSLGNWLGIGSFKGNFDGNNKTISNIYSYYSSVGSSDWSKTCGLFASVQVGGNIHNVIIAGITAYGRYAGGVASVCRGTISHCKVLSGTISGYQCFGGICGWFGDGAVVEYCENYASVVKSSWGHTIPLAGGIAGGPGSGTPYSYIRYNINYANISFSSGTNTNIGGIVGATAGSSAYNLSVINNLNLGSFYCNSARNGGIIGNNGSGTIQGNMYAGIITSNASYSGAILGDVQVTSGNYTYIYGNLNVGESYNSSSNNIYPINYQGQNNTNYPNYFITEFNKYTGTKTGVTASTSFNLVCTADNTRPPAITNTSFWTTDNFVFKKGYYPFPKGLELTNLDACLCAATPIILASGNTYAIITGPVQLGTGESYDDGITWTSSDTSKMTISVGGNPNTGETYYVGTPVATGSVTLTNWKNGKAYKKINLTITGTV